MATRQNIRQHLAKKLEPHFKSTFDYRPANIFETDLPCAAVYFEDGETERDYQGEPFTTARCIIEVKTRFDGNIDAELDRLASNILGIITEDRELNGLVDYIGRSGFFYDRDPEGFDGTLQLHFDVLYEDED